MRTDLKVELDPRIIELRLPGQIRSVEAAFDMKQRIEERRILEHNYEGRLPETDTSNDPQPTLVRGSDIHFSVTITRIGRSR